MQMPEMGGMETARQLMRQWPDERRPRIIALTADVKETMKQQCREVGMDGFLPKPVKKKALAETLENAPL